MPTPIKRLLERNALLIAVSFTFIIAFLSLVSLKGVAKINISNSDKIGHLVAYFILGLSWFHVFKKQRKKWLYITLLLIIYGMVLEGLQGTLTTYRTADLYDEFANASGVLIALLVSYLWLKKREN
ncbi:VanZ family protein [Aureibaculum conchae]|uniref:VanZ family protein n=1 Tax=Aureibaculum sp. 2308TA14-22 TaxID=3108392 RepID=UPI00339B09FC